MFKRFCLMIICAVLILTHISNTFACTKDCFLRAKFRYTVCRLKTPRKLVNYNWWHFEYISDKYTYGYDYWKEPFETFVDQNGDCDDYAIWNWYVLKHHGYNPKLLLVQIDCDKLHLLVRCTYKGKTIYVNQYSVWRKLPKGWKLKRVMNKPLPYKEEPLEKEKGHIILHEGESIVIDINK